MSTLYQLRTLETQFYDICSRLKVRVPIGIMDRFHIIEMAALTYLGRHNVDAIIDGDEIGEIATAEFKRLQRKLAPRITRLRTKLLDLK